jgi:formiminoglutamase
MPDYKSADIAIIGIEENDDQAINPSDVIRQKLYSLKKGTGKYNIVDFGNIRKGIDVSETKLRLQEVCQYLLEQNTLPVIVGGTHDFDYAQYQAYEDMDKLVS